MTLKRFKIKYKAMRIYNGNILAENKLKASKRFLTAYNGAYRKASNIKIISIVEDK
jgi:hypothetical protein